MAAAAVAQPIATQAQTPTTTPSTTNWAPSVKVSYGPIAGAISALVMWLLESIGVLKSVDAATVGPAITTIVTFATQYYIQSRK